MKTAVAYLSKQSPMMLAGAGVLVIGVVYLLARQTVKDVVGAAGAVGQAGVGLVTGNNAITQNQTNFDGEATSAYEGKGIFGTLGGATNAVLGGAPASIGESLGGWLFDIFGPKYDPNAPAAPRVDVGGKGGSFD